MMHPHNLWSLWDMLKAYAAEYVRWAKTLAEIETFVETAVKGGAMHKPVPKGWQKKFQRWSEDLKTMSDEIALPMVKAQLDRILAMMKEGESHTAEFVATVKQLRPRLEDELEAHKFFYVPPHLVNFYGSRFGDDVDDKFPEAITDIECAGKCLVLSQGTASVFHLMRAMECAVQELTKALGFANTDRVWGHLLSDMHTAIESMSKGETRNRWSECHSFLYNVKQAWRNDTMHPKQQYDESEAMEVYTAVNSFMSHLSQMI